MSAFKELFQGLGFITEGMRLLRTHKALLPFAVIPFLIDIVGFVVGVSLGASYLSQWTTAMLATVGTYITGFWYDLLYYPLLFLLWIVFLILLGYFIFIVGSLIAAPFHSLLAERALMKFGALQSRPFKLREWLSTTLRMLMISLVKAVVFALVGLFVFILSFFPVVNLVGSFIACLIVAFDTMDYSFEMKEWNFKTRLAFFRSEFPRFSGMALVLGLTLMIPGFTLLCYPMAVVGAASQLAQSKRLQKGIS